MAELAATVRGEAATREQLAKLLEDVAASLRGARASPSTVGVVVVYNSDNSPRVNTLIKGVDLMRLSYGAHVLQMRCDDEMLMLSPAGDSK